MEYMVTWALKSKVQLLLEKVFQKFPNQNIARNLQMHSESSSILKRSLNLQILVPPFR